MTNLKANIAKYIRFVCGENALQGADTSSELMQHILYFNAIHADFKYYLYECIPMSVDNSKSILLSPDTIITYIDRIMPACELWKNKLLTIAVEPNGDPYVCHVEAGWVALVPFNIKIYDELNILSECIQYFRNIDEFISELLLVLDIY